jgi:hypothetical protein
VKRVVVISDLHSGHLAGLTAPGFDSRPGRDESELAHKFWKVRRQIWNFVAKEAEALQPIDALIVNGDAVDGKGERSGATEELTTDRNVQAKMGAAAINLFRAGKVFMSYGTMYHTGVSEDWEDAVADEVNAEHIGSHDWLDVNGVVFDYKHHVSGSTVPHGRYTAIARERLWNVLWNEHGEFPKATIIIRSHVHYHVYCGDGSWLALTTPALMGYGTKWGKRRMSGTVDCGFIHFDVEGPKEWTWQAHLLRFKSGRKPANL